MTKQNRVFVGEWKALIANSVPISTNRIKPGNFYKLNTYQYTDGKVRSLSGQKTSHIFVIGKFSKDKNTYLAALKLKGISPEWFFEDIKQALKFKPLTDKQIDNVNETYSEDLDEFRHLLLKFPMDGRPLFNIIKRKRRIYEGNYREYKFASIKSIEYIDIFSNYLKSKTTIDSKKTDEVLNRESALNTREASVKKQIVKPK
jgi:hypothetical protein